MLSRLFASGMRLAAAGLVLSLTACQEQTAPPAPPAPAKAAPKPLASPAIATPPPATVPATAPIEPVSKEVAVKCKVFELPWGDTWWVEWGQKNPVEGEKWYDTIEEKMKKADLSVVPQCTHLTHMFLGFTNLEDLKIVAGLTNLKKLDLRMSPKITDLSPLKSLVDLEDLVVSQTGVKDISPLVALPRLRVLEAQMLLLTDVTPVAQMKEITHVDFLRSPIKDMTPFVRAPKLTWIRFCNSEVPDLKALLPVAERITELEFCETKITDFDSLKAFKNLRLLRLWGTPLVDLGVVADMKDLERIDISKTNVKDLSPLFGLKNLKEVDMLMMDVTDAEAKKLDGQVEELKKAVPGIEVVQKMVVN